MHKKTDQNPDRQDRSPHRHDRAQKPDLHRYPWDRLWRQETEMEESKSQRGDKIAPTSGLRKAIGGDRRLGKEVDGENEV